MKFSRKLLGAALLASLLVACGDADNAAQAAGTTPGIVVRNDGSAGPRLATAAPEGMQRAVIMDNNGFERPLPAYYVQIPAGWQASGAVKWDIQSGCDATMISPVWMARSADGSQMVEIMQRHASHYSTNIFADSFTNCPVMPLRNIREYLHYVASTRHPHAKVLDYRDRPDLAAKVPIFPSFDIPGGGIESFSYGDAGEILIGWEENGRAVREAIVSLGISGGKTAQVPMAGMHHGVYVLTNGAVALRAPDGQLDLALLEQIRQSIKPDPEWDARIAKGVQQRMDIQREGNQIAMDEIRKRGQIQYQTQQEISAMQQNTWQNTSATSERIQNRTIDGIREVQPYYDPVRGTPIEVDNRYQYLWRLSDGTYFQTNNPNFNPATELGIDGQQLQQVPR